MNRTNEIELLTNPAYHTMSYNGYIKNAIPLVLITWNKEYFN